MKKKTDRQKLAMWQRRLAKNQAAFDDEVSKMDSRQSLYLGKDEISPLVLGQRKKRTPHVRNICAELIEAQTDSSIPQPKVTAIRPQDEQKAKLIENMIRNEMDRLPFEQMNDMLERTVPIQGGAAFLVEWDNTHRTHFTVGELAVSVLHPKQLVPQDGVFSGISDMDYIILKLSQTKEYIKQRYGVDVSDESETEPDIKSTQDAKAADDLVTQYVAYYKNGKGGIGLYSWVNDVMLEDLEDYQARRLRKCEKCGAVEPSGSEAAFLAAEDGLLPGMTPQGVPGGAEAADALWNANKPCLQPPGGRKVCPFCGADKWREQPADFEEIYFPIKRSDGSVIPGQVMRPKISEEITNEANLPVVEYVAEPTRIPFYKPDIFPVILQKNVSVYGKFLGDSDIDNDCQPAKHHQPH